MAPRTRSSTSPSAAALASRILPRGGDGGDEAALPAGLGVTSWAASCTRARAPPARRPGTRGADGRRSSLPDVVDWIRALAASEARQAEGLFERREERGVVSHALPRPGFVSGPTGMNRMGAVPSPPFVRPTR